MTTTDPLVTSRAQLEALCERLAASRCVAVDTEFLRTRTYFAKLCLVQVATEQEHALIDPLAFDDLEPLQAALTSSSTVKILHAGRSDLEIFHDTWSVVPAPVFDTQLAATVLGFGPQVGYANLVGEVLGVQLEKAGTLTDWSRRPLSAGQVKYAIDDVVHLVPLWRKLQSMLEEQGRTGWLDAESKALVDPSTYQVDPLETWRHVRGGGSLRGEARAVLREVAAWRERAARERDLPRRWVVGDEALIEIARRRPSDVRDLGQVRGLDDAWLARHAKAVLEAVARGAAADGGAPAAQRRTSPDAEALADLMGCLVKLRARERGVAAGQLASREALEKVASEGDVAGIPVLEGWRREMVGEELLALRAGRLRLGVRDGAVVVESA